MTAEPKKYFVRFSEEKDHQKLEEFYHQNAHKNVRKRSPGLIRKLAGDGAVVLVEDEEGVIVAASVSYPHVVKDKDGDDHVMWQEVGSTRIILNGYPGLFDAMIALQTLKTFMVEPPEDRFVAQMRTVPVQNLAGKLGWRKFTAPDGLMKSKIDSIDAADVGAISDDNWFQCGIEALPVMAAWMTKVMDNPVLENPKTGEKIVLDFSKSKFFKFFEPEIRNLAQKNLGDVENPDMSRGLAKAHKKWLKNLFR